MCPHPTGAVLNHQACPRSQARLTAPTEQQCLATQLSQLGTKLPLAALQHITKHPTAHGKHPWRRGPSAPLQLLSGQGQHQLPGGESTEPWVLQGDRVVGLAEAQGDAAPSWAVLTAPRCLSLG